MTLFQNIITRELILNKERESLREQTITETNESKGLINRSPKIKKIKEEKEHAEMTTSPTLLPHLELRRKIREVKEEKEEKEHKMNRNISMENFVKYSWSWTL